MNLYRLFVLICLWAHTAAWAQTTPKQDPMLCTVQLPHKAADVLQVSIKLPALATAEALFVLPTAVPGIYAKLNFGQYVSNFKAYDAKGALLETTKADTNSWKLPQATRRISYDVDDMWESMNADAHYKSAGSMLAADTAYVLNPSNFVGYLDGQTDRPYTVKYHKPKGFYGACQLPAKKEKDTIDVFSAASYKELVDAPILYARPDTASVLVGNARIRVAAFAENGQKVAPDIIKLLQPQLEQQLQMLGGTLPTSRYTYLFYVAKGVAGGYRMDGLEHRQSSLCLAQGASLADMAPHLLSLAAHEFFHTLAPLNIQSDIVGKFDFRNPVFDKHLWFYEGMTEYLTMLLPVRYGDKTPEDFAYAISQKVKEAAKYDPKLALADMSRQAMTRQDQYGNFYAKGALVCLALDIKLRNAQLGTSGMPEALMLLMSQHGANKFFKEKEFYDVLGRASQPDFYYFLRDVVDDNKPMPLVELLASAGFQLDNTTGEVLLTDQANALQRTLRQWWLRK